MKSSKLRIKWVGPVSDYSGYSQANRDYICALSRNKNVEITVKDVSFDAVPHPTILNDFPEVRNSINKDIGYDVVVQHMTPNNYNRFSEKDKFNVGYAAWETSHIQKDWVDLINQNVDLQFVPSEYNQQAFINSGVSVPVGVIPHTMNFDYLDSIDGKIKLDEKYTDHFKFYSIFQWTERKNPVGLLTAYFTEFNEDDKVVLILKTYGNDASKEQQNIIKERIKEIKNNLNLKYYPPIVFIGDSLEYNEIIKIHNTGDCFVLAQRSEGWGIPHFEAHSNGKPVITTGFGGVMEFCSTEYTHLLDYKLTPCYGMPWIKHYNGKQNWADPDIMQLKKIMRLVTINSSSNIECGRIAKEIIRKNFSYDEVSKKIVRAIRETIHFEDTGKFLDEDEDD